ncbi:transglycosylase SLT domain-containing protein [Shewanella gelidimarina]|uniref:transglycosylase SLT domain-containing protein n=1 Tax=Shewanella gelidimarina TaxID=56813 RepID=UPI00200DEEDD|nr:transglycosylase SLT domain-containing protein [Shewanella gelidimarina]MCL1059513.1 transglycosylase SLT domain-containing protein [Shewanella gelidimarina]
MRKLILAVIFLPSLVHATDASFDEFKKDWQEQQQNHIQQQQQEYDAFRTEYLSDYDKFRGQLLQNWAVPVQSSMDQQIVYSGDLQSRVIVDEEAQTLTIEQLDTNVPFEPEAVITELLDEGNAAPVLQVIIDNEESVKKLQQSTPTISAQPKVAVSEKVLEQQIVVQYEQVFNSLDADETITESEVKAKKEVLEKQQKVRVENLVKQVDKVKTQDVKYKNIKSYTIALPEDYLYRKASPFLDSFSKQASDHQQELALLLAISHAESSFNPQAKSHIPAFGLMQIVPRSAGMDVANKLLKQSAAPTANELYQPETNILYGAGYLSILSDRYLKGIKDPKSQKYCVIAAYNTGAGNVAKAFNGGNSRNVKQALVKINAMSSEQVYQTLLKRLPYSETKKYLKKVRKLEEQYHSKLPTWNGNSKL